MNLLFLIKKQFNSKIKSPGQISDFTRRHIDITSTGMKRIQNMSDVDKSALNLKELIKMTINMTGPITLEEYMKTCLYDPKYGYYTTKEHIFGARGDFVTSPEISQLFGECLSFFINNTLGTSFKNPPKWDLIEIGPGRGFLMVDIVRSLFKMKALNGMNLIMIETSDRLAKIQQENINNTLLKHKILTEYKYDKENKIDIFECKQHNFTMKWYKSLEEYISKRNGIVFEDAGGNVYKNILKYSTSVKENPKLNPVIIINNEFFDAIPTKKFIYKSNQWRECTIDNDPVLSDEAGQEGGRINFKYNFTEPNSEGVVKYLQPEKTFESLGIKNKENDTYEYSPQRKKF